MKLCIIGGGIMGLMVAYQAITKLKYQFREIYLFDAGLPGSSVGDVKALNMAYSGVYLKAVQYAKGYWLKLLHELSGKYYFPIGNLYVNHDNYTPSKFSSYPKLYQVGNNSYQALYDISAGLLDNQAIQALLIRIIRQLGVKCYFNTSVTKVCDKSSRLYYKSDSNIKSVRYDRCVLAGGAWINQILKKSNLPKIKYRITLEQITLLKIPPHTPPSQLPTHIISGELHGNFCYTYPPITGSELHTDHFKVVVHTHPNIDTTTTISQLQNRNIKPPNHQLLESAIQFCQKYLQPDTYNLLANQAEIDYLRCPYTYRDDGTGSDFIVSKLPNHPNIIVMVGFRGEGFKFSPTMANYLCI
jgi:glycine/D-amino acid oxidase-like deaminating enzyme